MAENIWYPTAVDMLRDLAPKGESALNIATMINMACGTTFRKGAIIGKAMRLGVPLLVRGRPRSSNPDTLKALYQCAEEKTGKLEAARRIGVTIRTLNAKCKELGITIELGSRKPRKDRIEQPAPEPRPEPLYVAPIEALFPVSDRINVNTLREHMCKWPVGDPRTPEFYFCGTRAVDGPYCSHHHQIAYRPQREKRAETRRAVWGLGKVYAI